MIDTVVIGSGFGGAVVACRLAAAGRSVCVLERGRRWSAPEFPRSLGEVSGAFWDPDAATHGFLEYLAFRHFDVIQGSGVGGGSLHYFNVNLPAPPQVFRQPAWPEVFGRVDLHAFYDTARAVLRSTPLHPPEGRDLPARTAAFLAAATHAGYDPELVPIAVHTGPDGQLDGVGRESACTYCGNCLFGCNDGAKRSLDRNYLAMAEAAGADIRPLHHVDAIVAQPDDTYEVRYRVLPATPADGPAQHGSLRAREVVVSAGSLGSTELLLRCRDELGVLPRLGPALGTRFSTNGEMLFAYARDVPALVSPGIGPPITARVTARDGDDLVTVEDLGVPDSLLWFLEGAVPPPLARLRRLASMAMSYVGRTHGRGGRAGVRLSSLVSNGRAGHALPFLGMGTDSSDGEIHLRGGHVDVTWHPARNRRMYRLMHRTMRDLSAGAGGRYTSSFVGRWPMRKFVTAHPLGGCPMGDDPRTSVVDDCGRAHGHPGLWVVDGSMIPSALAVNPSLTIAALAERAAAAMVDPVTASDRLIPVRT